MSAGLRAVQALRIGPDGTRACEDAVIEESPVALLYNGLSFAVMMATPVDLEDFALGFALCEGIVADAREFSLVDVVRDAAGVALHAAIPQARFDALEGRARGLEGRSGCGLCGIAELRDVLRAPPRVADGRAFSPGGIHAALEALARRQPMNARSGGVHAAGFARGDATWVREDVGRHNAVDKLVGALQRATPAIDAKDGMLVVTSRASYEIVRKAAFAGIPVVVAMSAPTAQAIAQADAAGITLVAFARDARMTVYAGHGRIALA